MNDRIGRAAAALASGRAGFWSEVLAAVRLGRALRHQHAPRPASPPDAGKDAERRQGAEPPESANR